MRRRRQEAFDPYELGARRSDPTLGGAEPLPPVPRRLRPLPLLGLLAGAVVIVAVVQSSPSRTPALARSCTRAAVALSTREVRQFGVVRWTTVGPAAGRVVFALDSATVPAAGSPALLAGPLAVTGCRRTGQFGVRAEPGAHTVTAFSLAPDGTPTRIGRRPLTVTAD